MATNWYKSLNNGEDALAYIVKDPPDVLVMDIEINGALSGIDVVKKMNNPEVPVIFITGVLDETIYEKARLTIPMAYLIKPFSKFTFQTALENCIVALSRGKNTVKPEGEWHEDLLIKDSFFVKRNNLLQKVKLDEILFIQSEGNYCEIFTKKKYAIKLSLTKLLKKLPPAQFVRIHQRYIVQTDLIEVIDIYANEVQIGSQQLPIGPKYRDELIKMLDRL